MSVTDLIRKLKKSDHISGMSCTFFLQLIFKYNLRSKITSYSSFIVWLLQDISTANVCINIHSFMFADMLLISQVIEIARQVKWRTVYWSTRCYKSSEVTKSIIWQRLDKIKQKIITDKTTVDIYYFATFT